MKHLLFLFCLFTITIHSQENSSDEYLMNTFKVIHIENNDIYRVGLANIGGEFIKKSNSGEDIAKLELCEKGNKMKCRGVFYHENFFYSVNFKDDFKEMQIILKKINKDLHVIEEKIIFSEASTKMKRDGEIYFDFNENGFVLVRDFTNRIKVILETYTYNFKTEKVFNYQLSFISRKNLEIMDFEISNDLKVAMIMDADEAIGTLKTSVLKDLESYLIYSEPNDKIHAIKLTEDENYFERSFNLTFKDEEVIVAHLNFDNPSNILAGYTVKKYASKQGEPFNLVHNSYFPFEDYASREEWGPALKEAQKQYRKDQNSKNTRYESFGALEISDLMVNNDKAILIIREVFDVPATNPNQGVSVNPAIAAGTPRHYTSTSTYGVPESSTYSTKRFKEFQLTKLDLQSQQIVWWNRIYNTPYTNGMRKADRVFQGDFFWSDQNKSSLSKVYFPYIKDNKLVLLYPTYKSLYEDNGELKSEIVNQRPLIPLKFLVYSYIGKSEVDINTGKVENSLVLSDYDKLGKIISATIINLNAFYVDNKNLITPIEHLMNRNSILSIEDK